MMHDESVITDKKRLYTFVKRVTQKKTFCVRDYNLLEIYSVDFRRECLRPPLPRLFGRFMEGMSIKKESNTSPRLGRVFSLPVLTNAR